MEKESNCVSLCPEYSGFQLLYTPLLKKEKLLQSQKYNKAEVGLHLTKE